jgi:hypothetical protein
MGTDKISAVKNESCLGERFFSLNIRQLNAVVIK